MKENINKITPCIWFAADGGKLNKVLEYYQNVFDENFHANAIIPLGETPSGYAEMCEIQIFGQSYLLMSTAKEHHPLNDAMALMINCENQEEIDHFWNYFTQEGKEAPCGWCIDRYGLRWQIIPKNMNELMSQPNAQQVMYSQKKIIIKEYFK